MDNAARSRRTVAVCALIALLSLTAPLISGGTNDLSTVAVDIQGAGESSPAGLHLEAWELVDDSALPPTVDVVRPDPMVYLINRDGTSQVAWSPSPPLRPPILRSLS